MVKNDKMIYGIEAFANIQDSRSFATDPNTGVVVGASSHYALGVVGKVGRMLNDSTHIYGVLGAGTQNVKATASDGSIDVNKQQAFAVAGLGMETKLCEKMSLFMQYDYYIPFNTDINVSGTSITYKVEKQVGKIGARYYM